MVLTPEDMRKLSKRLPCWHENNIEMLARIYEDHYTLHCHLCEKPVVHATSAVNKIDLRRNDFVCSQCMNEFKRALKEARQGIKN